MCNTKFDWQGYSAEKLVELCKEPTTNKNKRTHNWVTDCYSAGVFLREYAYYPSSLPLHCYSAHGVNLDSSVGKHDLSNDAPFMLFYTSKNVALFKTLSTQPVYKVPAPLPWLRKKRGIVQSSDAKGTLVFFSHTTPDIGFEEEPKKVIGEYIDDLQKLPSEMHPICVCLHMHDINNGDYQHFLDRNIPVYTAGNAFSEEFAENFYSILRNFKHSTSSSLGSNVWYSLEMGIPFFIHGNHPVYYNYTSNQVEKGIYTSYKTESYYKVLDLFSNFSLTITPEQKELVQTLVGEEGSISRIKLSFLLYKPYLLYKIRRFYKSKLKSLKKRLRLL